MSNRKEPLPPESISSSTTDARSIRLGWLISKASLLFIVLNLVFAYFYPLPFLGKVSAYNRIFPGRSRLPYGDNPQTSYNLNLYNLEAMFASHEIHRKPKADDEFRVILVGDSATWGFLLQPDQTTSAQINKLNQSLPDGRRIQAYNLGYPVMSLTKDLLILSRISSYQPDLIVWAITLESFPYDKQLFPPLLQNNASIVRDLIIQNKLNLETNSPDLIDLTFWDRTIVGARRPLADLVRLQLYGVMWAATGIDQEIPTIYSPAMLDLTDDLTFHNLQPPHIKSTDIAIDVLKAGFNMAGEIPILLVNEPMLISQGQNSDLRYNFFYPRWAYDEYRQLMSSLAAEENWHYVDFWNAIPAYEFTNSAVHLSPKGNQQFASILMQAIQDAAQTEPSTRE